MRSTLTRLELLTLAMLGALLIMGCIPGSGDAMPPKQDPVLEFHHNLLTLDSHVDTPLRLRSEGIDLGVRHDPRIDRSKLDFPRMEEGGLDVVFFAVWTKQGARTDSGHSAVKEKAYDLLNLSKARLADHPDKNVQAVSASEAKQIVSSGKHAIYYGLENGYPIGRDLLNVDEFYQAGIRYITLCHTSNNELCDSSTDTTEHGGLSPFGEQVVKRMNELGMIIDISHVSDATVKDVLSLSKAPVVASHSCARALADHDRNLSDDLIKEIGAHGGVIQLALFSEYIVTEKPNPGRDSAKAVFNEKWADIPRSDPEVQEKYRQERRALNQQYPRFLPRVSDAIDHIDHIVDLVGVDHVGIGSDFDGGGELADCYDVTELPNITRELLKRGYTKEDIQKIWSGNFLRVFAEVEAIASGG